MLDARRKSTFGCCDRSKVAGLLRGLETYVAGQSELIIDYATGGTGRTDIDAITESTVQSLHRRMGASNRLRWSRGSASDAQGPNSLVNAVRSGPCRPRSAGPGRVSSSGVSTQVLDGLQSFARGFASLMMWSLPSP